MSRRLFALALCLCLVAVMLPKADALNREPMKMESVDQCCHTLRVNPLSPNYVRPAFDGKLSEITPQRVEDTFRYLDELYVQQYPEAALSVYTGTEEDRANLKQLAETITEGCTTDKEKADAIDRWMVRNINYDENTSAFASDTFYRREGNCLSYANLMQFLLRSLGIPAVVGDGWRGDMEENTVDLFNMVGHAWCFVYLDGEWVLYDPLWIVCGTTDREYMAKWIYFDTVEFVCPAYDPDNLPPEAFDKVKAYYTNGKPHLWGEFMSNTVGASFLFVNNQCYAFVSNQCEEGGSQDGMYYLDGVSDKTQMEMGELYRNSWVSYGDYLDGKAMHLTYAHPNGMMVDGAVMEYDSIDWLMYANQCTPILADEEDYFIADGRMTLKPGYVGPFLGTPWQDGCVEEDYIVTWESFSEDDEEVATVDQNGIITCHAEGWAQFRVKLQRQEKDGSLTHMSGCIMQIYVSSEDRTPDFTDHQEHDHVWAFSRRIAATCEDWGIDIYTCTICGTETEVYSIEPLGHDHSTIEVVEPTCVDVGYTKRTCIRCDDSYTEDPVDPLGHDVGDWVKTKPETCTEPGEEQGKCSRCDYYETRDIPAGHSYGDWYVTREASWKESGEERRDCVRCDHHETRELELVNPFADVSENRYYYKPIMWAYENGITGGKTPTTFEPDSTCTRAQVMTFLWAAAGRPEPTSTENPFTDVSESRYYYKAVLWAVENGITGGTSANTFSPNASCTRNQVVTFLWVNAGRPEPTIDNPFTDVEQGKYYYKAILWAYENGITTGRTPTTFEPHSSCTRGQIMTFLFQALADK